MSDDVEITAGTGTPIATDDCGGKHVQVIKIAYSADGVRTPVPADVDGMLVNLGTNNDVTVTGEVTIDDSTPVDVAITNASIAVTGTVTASDGGGTISVDDGGGTITVDGAVTVSGTATVSGTVTANLAAGTNNIGDVDVLTLPALVAGSANIGDVDVLTVPADPFGVNADAASATGSISAKLRFIASTGIPITGSVTVGSHAVTNAGVFATQVDGAALTSLQLIDDIVAVAHNANDAGNPLKIGGKVSTSAPTPIAAAQRTDAWFDAYGRIVTSDYDPETAMNIGSTGLRDRLYAQRCTVLADSLADGLAGFWTSATANGGTATSSGGEGLLQTSANATGSAQLTSTTVPYFPGMVAWFNSAVRFNDTGSAGNIRRIGVFTVSGTTPQDGFYYELNGTTLNAVVAIGGVATAVASTSWSQFAIAPFTLDTNYHSFELRYTANTVWFYVDNVLRHRVSGTSAAITATLNFPITIVSVNTSGASNRLIAVRNCGIGRFGEQQQAVAETGLSAVQAIAVGGGTPHDSVDSGSPQKIGGKALSTAPTAVADSDRVNAWFSLNGALNVISTKDTQRISVASTSLTTAATPYAAGDQVATEFTLANAARSSGGGGTIVGVVVISAADTTGPFDVVFTNATITLAGNDAVWAISDADALKIQGLVQCAANYDIGNNRIAQAFNLAIPYVCAATSLFASLITRTVIAATPFGNNADIQLIVYVERN